MDPLNNHNSIFTPYSRTLYRCWTNPLTTVRFGSFTGAVPCLPVTLAPDFPIIALATCSPQPGLHTPESILAVQKELLATGLSNRSWDRVVFTFHPSYASTMLLNLGSWDASKRQLVRRVLQEARENFHRHPRPWYALRRDKP